MIQRIQSLFLLLAAGAAFSLFGLPFAATDQAVPESQFFRDQAYNIQDHIGLTVLFVLAGALALFALFSFNDRKRQLMLTRVALVADIIGIVLAVVLAVVDGGQAQYYDNPTDSLGLFMPLLFIVFILLAMRYIRKDEKLVRSMDRLR